ncbi:MAG TPA: hypothetical protein VNL98_05885, partial [Gemmatimonadales bacterium]|nr:hypothetical protein [Gemmatimonadales bacterium]
SLTLQRRTIPPHVEAAIRTALQKLPADRFSSAAQFAEALSRTGFTADMAPTVPSAAPARRLLIPDPRSLVPWAGWALAALAAAAAFGGWLAPGRSVELSRFAVNLPAEQAPRTDHDGTSLALSPDGRTLVYVGRGQRGRQLFVRRLEQLEARPIAGTDGAESPFFSPDGEWVAYFAEGKLRKVSLAGGPPLAVADVSSERGGVWGTDDQIVFVSSSTGGLLRVSAAGGSVDTLTTLRTDSGEISHRWPTLLPGNAAVVYGIQGPEGYSLAVVSLRERRQVILVRGASMAQYVATGHLVYATQEGSLVAVGFDPRSLRVTSSPVSLLEGLLVKVTGAAEFSISAGGTLAYLGGQTSGRTLVLVDQTGRERPLTRDLLGLAAPRFSPDGRRIALEALEQRSVAIRVLDTERGTLSRLTFEGQARYPEWTPDGRRIGFAWSRAGTLAYDLYQVAADGSGEPQELYRADNAQWEVAFAPSGRLAVFRESNPVSKRDLWVLPLDSPRVARPYLRTPFEERTPAISPDGRWLAYTSDESSVDEVYVRAFPEPSGRWQVSISGGTEPRWARNGRTLYYRTADSLVAVEVRPGPVFDVGQRRSLFSAPYQRASQHADYDVSPDGRNFVFVKAGPDAANLVMVLGWFEELRRRTQGGAQVDARD